MAQLPYSQACENNKGPILSVLRGLLADRRGVLEIGSGTGQHACYFAAKMPWLQWQPTELPDNLPLLHPRCAACGLANLLPEKALDVCNDPWPVTVPDAVFSANCLHIMPFAAVERLFAGLGAHAGADVVLVIYGPFNYGGRYTSPSNERFDARLQQRDPHSGIRNFEDLDALAAASGMRLATDHTMPVNNRLLEWVKDPVR